MEAELRRHPTLDERFDPAIRIVDYDPEWPHEFEREARAIQKALGDLVVRIEHVGSTAVPEVPAKPVVDIQVSVADVEDEASYVAAIESLGVPLRLREPEHRYFRPAGDQPRTVHIHVCNAGGEWEREHLLFRDYLRASPDARRAYAQLKQELAERYRDDRLAYTDAKTGFILDTLDDAKVWAERTRWAGGGRK